LPVAHFAHVFLFVVVVFPLILLTVLSPLILPVFVYEFDVPRLHKEFGFVGDRVYVPDLSFRVFRIKSVVPGGRFAAPGFQPDDVPIGYHHDSLVGFYADLETVLETGTAQSFTVVPLQDIKNGLGKSRRVTIRVGTSAGPAEERHGSAAH